MPFQKINYIFFILGILFIALGFILMAFDSCEHGFGIIGLTISPIIVMLGFVIEVFAIMYHKKND